MRGTKFTTGHMVYNPAYNQILQRKVTKDRQILAVIPRPPEVDPGLFIRYKIVYPIIV